MVCCASGGTPAIGADLGTVAGFDVRLDTTLRGSLGLRTGSPDDDLLSDPNSDDGDRAFKPGINSERIDFTSQLDIVRGELGFDLGTDGWYDAIYHQGDADRSPATFNPISVPAGSFPGGTSRLDGGMIELGDAYVHDNVSIGGLPITVRVGRQTLLWGESLFFPQDGIAAGQAPVDEIKEISQPLVESNELFLPVAQADIRVQLGHGLSVEAYEQFEWRRDRSPGVASYFSTSDVLDVGGERAFVPGGALLRGEDNTPAGTGQFGGALRYASGGLDLGLYALRYAEKDPQLIIPAARPDFYQLDFPSGITLVGASASGYIGSVSVSGEVSERWHTPLVSVGLPGVSSGGDVPRVESPVAVTLAPEPGYATGRSLQALLSLDAQLRPGRLWNGATVDAEIVGTDLLGVQSGRSQRLPGTTHVATALEAVFTPQYFQLLPNVDVTVPLGVQIGLSGRSSLDSSLVAGTGNATISVTAVYRIVWQGGISFTHFIGSAAAQPLADRDFLIFTLSRTF